jgi:hypothetical protein
LIAIDYARLDMTPDRDAITLDDVRQRAEVVSPHCLSIGQAARMLPPGRNGRPTHTATLVRWITSGTASPSGEVVHLRAVRLGGRWLTTREWLDDYARRLTPGPRTAAPAPLKSRRDEAAGKASRELDRLRF